MRAGALGRLGRAQDAAVLLAHDLLQEAQRRVIVAVLPGHFVAAGPFDDAGMVAHLLDDVHRRRFEIGQEHRSRFRAAVGQGELLQQHDPQLVGAVVNRLGEDHPAAPEAQAVDPGRAGQFHQPRPARIHAAEQAVGREQVRAHLPHWPAVDDQLQRIDEIGWRARRLLPADFPDAETRRPPVEQFAGVRAPNFHCQLVQRLLALSRRPPERRLAAAAEWLRGDWFRP